MERKSIFELFFVICLLISPLNAVKLGSKANESHSTTITVANCKQYHEIKIVPALTYSVELLTEPLTVKKMLQYLKEQNPDLHEFYIKRFIKDLIKKNSRHLIIPKEPIDNDSDDLDDKNIAVNAPAPDDLIDIDSLLPISNSNNDGGNNGDGSVASPELVGAPAPDSNGDSSENTGVTTGNDQTQDNTNTSEGNGNSNENNQTQTNSDSGSNESTNTQNNNTSNNSGDSNTSNNSQTNQTNQNTGSSSGSGSTSGSGSATGSGSTTGSGNNSNSSPSGSTSSNNGNLSPQNITPALFEPEEAQFYENITENNNILESALSENDQGSNSGNQNNDNYGNSSPSEDLQNENSNDNEQQDYNDDRNDRTWIYKGPLGVEFVSEGVVRCGNSFINLYLPVPKGINYNTNNFVVTLSGDKLDLWNSEDISCYSNTLVVPLIEVASENEVIEESAKDRLCFYGRIVQFVHSDGRVVNYIIKTLYYDLKGELTMGCDAITWNNLFTLRFIYENANYIDGPHPTDATITIVSENNGFNGCYCGILGLRQ